MKRARALRAPDDPSYQRHREQVWAQILLPIILVALAFLVLTFFTVRSAFQTGGDVGRWAAISTIWLVLPVMVGGLIVLGVLGAAIFMVAKVVGLIPPYSCQAQRIFYRIEYGTKRLAEMVRRPVLLLNSLSATIKSEITKARERIW